MRSQPLHYTQYYDYERAREDHHVDQVFGAAILWPFPRDSTTTYLLLGAAYQHTADRWCIAEGESEPGGRVEFPAGFDCARDYPVSYVIRRWLPLYGVGLDSSRDARFFFRWQYRAQLYPSLGDFRIGVGVRFYAGSATGR